MPPLSSDLAFSDLLWKLLAGLWIASLIFLEFKWPKDTLSPNAPQDYRSRLKRWGRNFGLAGLNMVQSPLIIAPISFWFATHAFDWRLNLFPNLFPNLFEESFWSPFWLQGVAIALDVLLLDLWVYAWHRANHEIPFLWRFHEIHHRDPVLDASSALRFHFGEVILSALVRGLFIMFLGIDIISVLIFEGIVLIASMFHHSNISIPSRIEHILSRIIVTPSIHWVHHHAKRHDTDSNYATILSIWDPLFGTCSNIKRFEGMPIGVEGRTELNFLSLLLRPFKLR